jgi:hypothetical protein
MKKSAPRIAMIKKPSVADLLAAKLLLIQIECLNASPTLRKAMGINLSQLKKADSVRRELEGLRTAKGK